MFFEKDMVTFGRAFQEPDVGGGVVPVTPELPPVNIDAAAADFANMMTPGSLAFNFPTPSPTNLSDPQVGDFDFAAPAGNLASFTTPLGADAPQIIPSLVDTSSLTSGLSSGLIGPPNTYDFINISDGLFYGLSDAASMVSNSGVSIADPSGVLGLASSLAPMFDLGNPNSFASTLSIFDAQAMSGSASGGDSVLAADAVLAASLGDLTADFSLDLKALSDFFSTAASVAPTSGANNGGALAAQYAQIANNLSERANSLNFKAFGGGQPVSGATINTDLINVAEGIGQQLQNAGITNATAALKAPPIEFTAVPPTVTPAAPTADPAEFGFPADGTVIDLEGAADIAASPLQDRTLQHISDLETARDRLSLANVNPEADSAQALTDYNTQKINVSGYADSLDALADQQEAAGDSSAASATRAESAALRIALGQEAVGAPPTPQEDPFAQSRAPAAALEREAEKSAADTLSRVAPALEAAGLENPETPTVEEFFEADFEAERISLTREQFLALPADQRQVAALGKNALAKGVNAAGIKTGLNYLLLERGSVGFASGGQKGEMDSIDSAAKVVSAIMPDGRQATEYPDRANFVNKNGDYDVVGYRGAVSEWAANNLVSGGEPATQTADLPEEGAAFAQTTNRREYVKMMKQRDAIAARLEQPDVPSFERTRLSEQRDQIQAALDKSDSARILSGKDSFEASVVKPDVLRDRYDNIDVSKPKAAAKDLKELANDIAMAKKDFKGDAAAEASLEALSGEVAQDVLGSEEIQAELKTMRVEPSPLSRGVPFGREMIVNKDTGEQYLVPAGSTPTEAAAEKGWSMSDIDVYGRDGKLVTDDKPDGWLKDNAWWISLTVSTIGTIAAAIIASESNKDIAEMQIDFQKQQLKIANAAARSNYEEEQKEKSKPGPGPGIGRVFVA